VHKISTCVLAALRRIWSEVNSMVREFRAAAGSEPPQGRVAAASASPEYRAPVTLAGQAAFLAAARLEPGRPEVQHLEREHLEPERLELEHLEPAHPALGRLGSVHRAFPEAARLAEALPAPTLCRGPHRM
jgi:hypothetical protein